MFRRAIFITSLLILCGSMASAIVAQDSPEKIEMTGSIAYGPALDPYIQCLQWFKGHFASYRDASAINSLIGTYGLKTKIPNANYVHIECYIEQNPDETFNPWLEMKPEYAAAIAKAHTAGYGVIFRMQMLGNPSYPLHPTDFWTSLKAVTKDWAAYAQSKGVESFCIAVEFTSVEEPEFRADWEDLIQQVRNVFKGEVWYETNNWPHTTGADSLAHKKTLTWFGLLDYIGISAYWKMADHIAPTVSEMVNSWYSWIGEAELGMNIVDGCRELSAFFNKPILIVSGTASGSNPGADPPEGACMNPERPPNYWSNVSVLEQSRWYDAILTAFDGKPWLKGFSFDGAWRVTVNYDGNNHEFSVVNKVDTISAINKWFR